MSPSFPWLTASLLLPVGGALVLQLVPRRAAGLIKAWTLLIALAEAVLVGLIVYGVNSTPTTGSPLPVHFEEKIEWITSIGASYHVGIDGVSAWILALNAGVFLVGAVVVPARSTERLKFFCGLLLLTETATTGVLLSLDLLLFYGFWEGMLIPLYFLLSSYGNESRGRATVKFVVYTVAGSLLMLVAIIYLHFASGVNTFDLQTLLQHPPRSQTPVNLLFTRIPTLTPVQFAFLAFAVAFAIKLPIVPFHTWLPDLYESVPTPALVFFAGIVSKLGAYSLIRFAITLFSGPAHDFQPILMSLAALSIIYGALMALSEVDIKRIVAYASISHLGFVALGIFSLNANGINGAILQMVNHGIIIVSLFLVVGMIESRTGTRDRHELAGLERRAPWLYAFFLVITLSSLGLPGLNSFAGEFSVMLGAFQYAWIFALLAGIGVVLAAWYMLRLHQGLMHAPLQPRTEAVRDLHIREGLVLAPLVTLMIFLGVYPRPVGIVSAQSVPKYVSIANAQSAASSLPGGTTEASR